MPGVESIDAFGLDTALVGHSYFAENNLVIRDVHRVLGEAASPGSRPWLEPRAAGDRQRWAFRGDA